MIKKRVVFLLGAGASRGYGYPSGVELMTRLTAVSNDQLAVLEEEGVPREQVHQFMHQLRDCGLNSVDSFLKRNPAYAGAAISWNEAAASVGALTTIHLHGSIGPLPGFEHGRLPYGEIQGADEILQAAQGILTLGEAGSEKAYKAAAEFIQTAEVIISLGFGFHEEIISSLGIRGTSNVAVCGTCQGLTQSEVNRVARQFAPRQFVEMLRDGATWNSSPRVAGPAVDYVRAHVEQFE
jgi:hypothetical protein